MSMSSSILRTFVSSLSLQRLLHVPCVPGPGRAGKPLWQTADWNNKVNFTLTGWELHPRWACTTIQKTWAYTYSFHVISSLICLQCITKDGMFVSMSRCVSPKHLTLLHYYKNADELKVTIKETWASIPPQQCHKLITSTPHRIEAVIKAKGAPTKYWVHIQ